jgi:bisanhydrobacterioruberin hydratase
MIKMKDKSIIPLMPVIMIFLFIIIAFSGYMAGRGYSFEGQKAVAVIMILLISMPAIMAVLIMNRGAGLLLSLSAFAIIIETIGVLTGFPYGAFSYGEGMGYKLFGIVPIMLPFAYIPLVLGAYYIADKLTSNNGMIITITAFILLLMDLVIDPGAAAMGYWIWERGGLYYGIPFTNFIGWILSSIIAGMICLRYGSTIRKAKPRMLLISPWLIMLFYTSVAVALGMIIPSAIGIILLVFIGGILLSEKAQKYHHSNMARM